MLKLTGYEHCGYLSSYYRLWGRDFVLKSIYLGINTAANRKFPLLHRAGNFVGYSFRTYVLLQLCYSRNLLHYKSDCCGLQKKHLHGMLPFYCEQCTINFQLLRDTPFKETVLISRVIYIFVHLCLLNLIN